MKKLLMLMLVLTFLLGMTAVVMAATDNAARYTDPTPGTSPHGGYLATTSRCKICHSVHNPDSTDSFKLLRNTGDASVAGACAACHTDAAKTNNRPYTDGTFNGEHTIGEATIPDADDDSVLDYGTANALDCLDCHRAAPHAKGTPSGLGKLFLSSQGGTLTAVCANCHNRNNVAIFNSTSHPMTTALELRNGVSIAWDTSEDCTKCHAGTGDAPDLFPHRTNGYKLLKNAVTDNTTLDNVCVDCHTSDQNYDSAGEGVGDSF